VSREPPGSSSRYLRTDNGMEFQGEVSTWLEELGVERQYTAPYSPQQNGRVERWNRTMGEGTRTLLLDSGLPTNCWGEAVKHLTWVRNRVASAHHNYTKSPYEAFTGKKPDVSMLKAFGAIAVTLTPQQARGKLDSKGEVVVYIGVDDESKAWRVMNPSTGQVSISRNLRFQEDQLWKTWSAKHSAPASGPALNRKCWTLHPRKRNKFSLLHHHSQRRQLRHQSSHNSRLQPSHHQRPLWPPGPGSRGRCPSPALLEQGPTFLSREELGDLLEREEGVLRAVNELNTLTADTFLSDPDEAQAAMVQAWCMESGPAPDGLVTPGSVAEALKGPQSKEWSHAISSEHKAMVDFEVFGAPVDLPPGKTAVDSKLLLKIKRGQDGSVERFKARLVARGFTQTKGEDYEETFSNVAKWPTIRLLLALAAIFSWEVEVCDVDNAFLNSPLKEEVYLKQPHGMGDGTARVFRLKKALYGLKQSPRTWEQDLGTTYSRRGSSAASQIARST